MCAVLRAVAAGVMALVIAAAPGALLAGCTGVRANAPARARPATAPVEATAPAEAGALGVVQVVPRPRFGRLEPGSYRWPQRIRIALRGVAEGNVTRSLRELLAANGVVATVADGASPQADRAAADVTLEAAGTRDARLGDEAYALHVDRRGVTMRANTEHGLFYALQTLDQLSARSARGLTTQAVTIVDRPAYRWRGIQLDVARHFFPVPVVERFIDLAAHYKLNTFHWHLTDDQAWRLRSPRYPALGAGRDAYSEADVRAVIAYAARRYVTVVPEIDLPAHAGAVLRAYPRLACGDTLCTNGAGLAFARDVLRDVAARFPSPYVHVGGDEVPPAAAAAQPRFTAELERMLAARGRRLVGWDEIFTPRLAPRAVVMVWTSRGNAARAARHGNDVVLASGPLYFDGAQGDAAQEPPASRHMSTLENVYDDVVMPAGLDARAAAHVLGAQANVWTEHIETPERLFSMTLPRELALAETLWTPRADKHWTSFVARLPAQLAWLEAHGYPFRIPNASFTLSGGTVRFAAVPGRVQSVAAASSAPVLTVALTVPLRGAVVRYTTDASAPSPASRAYRSPFAVRLGRAPLRLRAAAFFRGRAGSITECTIARTSPAALRKMRRASTSWSALVSP